MVKHWDDYKELIIRYYIDEKMALNDVMKVMHDRHAFKASPRSYRQKFQNWGIRKYRDHSASSPSGSGSPPFRPPQPKHQFGHQSRHSQQQQQQQQQQHDWYTDHQGHWDEPWAKNTGSSVRTPDSDSGRATYGSSDMFDLPHRASPSSMTHGPPGAAMPQPVDRWTYVGNYESLSPPLSVHAAPSPTNQTYPSPGPSQNFQPYPQAPTGYDNSRHTASSDANHHRHSTDVATPWSILPPEQQRQLREAAYLDTYAQPGSHGRRDHAPEDYPEDEIDQYRRPGGSAYGTTGRSR